MTQSNAIEAVRSGRTSEPQLRAWLAGQVGWLVPAAALKVGFTHRVWIVRRAE